MIGVACVDFKKAFDSVSHAILEKKLKNSFGFEGNLLAWVKSYMNGRTEFIIVTGNVSTKLPIKFGIPQGLVLGPTLFVLFTNDLLSKITDGTLHMYADDTALLYIGRTANEVIKSLNLQCFRFDLMYANRKAHVDMSHGICAI